MKWITRIFGRKTNPRTLCLFSGGKDSAMVLLEEIGHSKKCISLIATSDAHAQLSDGPEAKTEIVKAISEEIFNTEAIIINTSKDNFRNELLEKIKEIIEDKDIDRIVTGDLEHPDGIIHFLRRELVQKYPHVSLFSIGEKYMDAGNFQTERYLKDVLNNLSLQVIGLRLPDFNGLENNFLCQQLDSEHLIELKNRNIDPLGEDGEYQSLVTGCTTSKKILKIKSSEIKTEKGRDSKNYTYMIQEINAWDIMSS